jgi:succinyl-diaminopimelate desuccinylase
VHGGLQRNIVPDRATAEIDVRLADPDLTARLTALDGSDLPHGSVLEVVVAVQPVATPPDDPLVGLARRIADELCGPGGDQPPAARFFTDASVLTPALGGVPTLVWGPGSPDQAHVVDEHCPVAHLDLAVAGYQHLLQALASH